jgi:RimJ/RimL family protein N-acetyltransferase
MSKLLIDLPEIISTPRLRLQMPKAGFGKQLHNAISDGFEDYVKWLNWPAKLPTIEEVEAECRRHHSEFVLRESMRYLVIDKVTEEVIGRCGLPSFQANWLIPQFGISYFIRKNQRSKGYASEAAHALATLAFKILKAKKVEVYCDAENIASAKVPIKIGFKLEYMQKGGWPRTDGELAELRTYSAFSESDLPKLEVMW